MLKTKENEFHVVVPKRIDTGFTRDLCPGGCDIVAIVVGFFTFSCLVYLVRDVSTEIIRKSSRSISDLPTRADVLGFEPKKDGFLAKYFWVVYTTEILVFVVEAIVPIAIGIFVILRTVYFVLS